MLPLNTGGEVLVGVVHSYTLMSPEQQRISRLTLIQDLNDFLLDIPQTDSDIIWVTGTKVGIWIWNWGRRP